MGPTQTGPIRTGLVYSVIFFRSELSPRGRPDFYYFVWRYESPYIPCVVPWDPPETFDSPRGSTVDLFFYPWSQYVGAPLFKTVRGPSNFLRGLGVYSNFRVDGGTEVRPLCDSSIESIGFESIDIVPLTVYYVKTI